MFEELTYVCLDLPEPAASQVIAIRRAQRDDFRAALPAEITVAGSGGVGELAVGQDPQQVFGVIDAIAAKTAPIPVSLGPVMRFPGTTIFVFTVQDEDRIRVLHRELAESSIRWRPAQFDFTPHCTLRSRSPVTESEAAQLLALRPPAPFIVDTLSVYEVKPDVAGRLPVVCDLLHRVRLKGEQDDSTGHLRRSDRAAS
jgi:2'-5' RNA ligase